MKKTSSTGSLKAKAIKLRQMGFSLTEIASQLSTAKSTVSSWLVGVKLTASAKKRLEERVVISREKGAVSRKKQREVESKTIVDNAAQGLASLSLTPSLARLALAILYCGAGNKGDLGRVAFTSSDSQTVEMFVKLLRKGFGIDSSKLRCLMYLYRSHNEAKQRAFWSKVTGIPGSQFTKTHIQPSPQRKSLADYPGCVRVTYYDSRVARELSIWYNGFGKLVKAG